MTNGSLDRIVDRLRRAGSVLPTTPDIESIVARAAQRKRRRQIGVTAASVMVVGGLGFSSSQMLRGSGDTSISAGVTSSALAPTTPTTSATPVAADTSERAGGLSSQWRPTTSSTTAAVASTTLHTGVTQSMQAARRSELSDGLGGAIVVLDGQLAHRHHDGSVTIVTLPDPWPTTERRIADVATIGDDPYLLVTDFTDRPDLAAEQPADDGSEPLHHDVAIYAVDLRTDEVHIVEQRTINDRHSPSWVYNGLVTAQNGRIMVVRELWQSMCVYVESLALDGSLLATPENPLPEPSLAGLDPDTIRDIQAGIVDPPRGCLSIDELPDGAMSVLGAKADSNMLDTINQQLRSAAALTADALGS